MRLRVGPELLTMLRRVRGISGRSYGDLARLALKAAAAEQPELADVDPGSTTGGETLILAGVEADQEHLRKVLTWRLARVKPEPPPSISLVEGRDYFVGEPSFEQAARALGIAP